MPDIPGCVLDLDFTTGVGRHAPDRSTNLSGCQTDGDIRHVLPLSYGMRSVTRCFDTAYGGASFKLFDLPPHCGFMGVEFESDGLGGAADLGKPGDANFFVSGFGVGAGLDYAPSLNVATQSAENYTPVLLSGVTGVFKVRCVYEVRGLPTPPYVPLPPEPIVVTAVADPDTIAPCETSALTATVLNGDGVSGVVWLIVSGPGSLSDITAFTATFNAPCPFEADAITIIRATSVEDPSASFEIPMSIDYTPVPPEEPVITGVVIGADPMSIDLDGGTSLITAFVTGTGDFNAGLSWAIVGGTGTGALSFDSVLTRILDGTAVGTVVIRATSTGDPSKWAEVTVGVTENSLLIEAFDDSDHFNAPVTAMNSWRDAEVEGPLDDMGGLLTSVLLRAYDGVDPVNVLMSVEPVANYNPDYNPDYYLDPVPENGNDWQVFVSGWYDPIGDFVWRAYLDGSTAWTVTEPFEVTIYATTEGTYQLVDPYEAIEPPFQTGSITLTVNPLPHLTSITVETSTPTTPTAEDLDYPVESSGSTTTVTVRAEGINLNPWYIGRNSFVRLIEQSVDEGLDPAGVYFNPWTDAGTDFVEVVIDDFILEATWGERDRQIRAKAAIYVEPQTLGTSETFTVPGGPRHWYLPYGPPRLGVGFDFIGTLTWSSTITVVLKIMVEGSTIGAFSPGTPTPFIYYTSVGGTPGTLGPMSAMGEEDLGNGYANLLYQFTYTAPPNPGGFSPTNADLVSFGDVLGLGDTVLKGSPAFDLGTGPDGAVETALSVP